MIAGFGRLTENDAHAKLPESHVASISDCQDCVAEPEKSSRPVERQTVIGGTGAIGDLSDYGRALWIATPSKDDSARSVAIDVWIEVISGVRADVDVLVAALLDVMEAGEIPVKRIVEALTEVSSVSSPHAWTAAEFVQPYIPRLESLPREIFQFLTHLLEWLTQLGLPVAESMHETVLSIRSGKPKRLAVKREGESATTRTRLPGDRTS